MRALLLIKHDRVTISFRKNKVRFFELLLEPLHIKLVPFEFLSKFLHFALMGCGAENYTLDLPSAQLYFDPVRFALVVFQLPFCGASALALSVADCVVELQISMSTSPRDGDHALFFGGETSSRGFLLVRFFRSRWAPCLECFDRSIQADLFKIV